MISRSLFAAALFITASTALAQGSAIQWTQCYGGGSIEKGKGQPTSDGGMVLVGTTSSNNGDVSGNHGGDDVWVVKLDAEGTLQWQRALGGSADDRGNGVQQTTDGGFIVAGVTASTDGDVTSNHGDQDAWVVKLDASGSIEWQHTLGGDSTDAFNAVDQTSDDGYLLAGYTFSNDGDVSGNHGMADYWIVRLDVNGSMLWQSTRGGIYDDQAYAIDETTDGGSIVTGYANSISGEISGCHGGTDIWMVKLDDQGAIEWQRACGGTSADISEVVRQTIDGGYILVGSTRSQNGDVNMNHSNGNSTYDLWVAKFSASGTLLWENTLGGVEDEQGYDVAPWDGGYLIAASAESSDGDVTGHHGLGASPDVWVVAIDDGGDLVWQRALGGTAQDIGASIHADVNGDLQVVGYTRSTDDQVVDSNGNYDLWALKLSTRFNSITGRVYVDLNSNAVYDAGEPELAEHSVATTNDPLVTWTHGDGTYQLDVFDSGTFNFAPAPLTHYTALPASRNVQFTGLNQVDSLNNFKFQPIGAVNDLEVSMAQLTPFRPGMLGQYIIRYRNVGTISLGGSLVFHLDPNTVFTSASVAPTALTTDSIVWAVPAMTPFEQGSIAVSVTVDQSVAIGTLLTSSTDLWADAEDAVPENNHALWEVLTTGSFDPNEILVSRASLLPSELTPPTALDYIINFQNTGNDTAFTVRIEDPVPANTRFDSFHVIGSSHPMAVTYNTTAHTLIFRFENILLPDSTTDEPGSHGHVHYRIEPRSDLIVGDEILNQASIFFDYNVPVLTNTARTVIEQYTAIDEVLRDDGLTLQPNPATGLAIVGWSTTEAKATLTLTDVAGRRVYTSMTSGQKHVLDTTGLPRGIYMVSLRTATGERTRRLVLE